MEFGLNEVLTIIDKVKSTELSLFEYQDMDTKIRIKGTRNASGASKTKCRMDGNVSRASSSKIETFGSSEYGAETLREAFGSSEYGAETLGETFEASEYRAKTFENASGYKNESKFCGDASGHFIIASPMVGTFYEASAEGEDPFVQVGDTVKKGQIVGIIEAMKLMNEIESEYDGVVEEILAVNEQMVEYGQPLIRIREV
ncbi:MAG: biotin/lipoyl-containing protein [Lachnospiraceae bacterium]|nr:biotin/lipoyl-containing protein [Lachnospiraceae bacterium]